MCEARTSGRRLLCCRLAAVSTSPPSPSIQHLLPLPSLYTPPLVRHALPSTLVTLTFSHPHLTHALSLYPNRRSLTVFAVSSGATHVSRPALCQDVRLLYSHSVKHPKSSHSPRQVRCDNRPLPSRHCRPRGIRNKSTGLACHHCLPSFRSNDPAYSRPLLSSCVGTNPARSVLFADNTIAYASRTSRCSTAHFEPRRSSTPGLHQLLLHKHFRPCRLGFVGSYPLSHLDFALAAVS